MVKLGVLGGTFDPIHNGHLTLAQTAYRCLNLDRVLFVPAGDPPHKHHRVLTAACHRAKMVELAIADSPEFVLSRIDLDRPGPHYSADMPALLQAEYPVSADTCFFIIGADSLIDLPRWHAPEQLLAHCRLAVAHRPGYRPNPADLLARLPALRNKITWLEMPAIPLSATVLRRQLSQDATVSVDSLPPVVASYIAANGLYQQDFFLPK